MCRLLVRKEKIKIFNSSIEFVKIFIEDKIDGETRRNAAFCLIKLRILNLRSTYISVYIISD